MMGRHIAEGEKSDLNLHVELCAERYYRLEEKFTAVESRLDQLHQDFSNFKNSAESSFDELKVLINESKDRKFSVMVTTAGTIIVALLGMMGYILTHLPN